MAFNKSNTQLTDRGSLFEIKYQPYGEKSKQIKKKKKKRKNKSDELSGYVFYFFLNRYEHFNSRVSRREQHTISATNPGTYVGLRLNTQQF